MNTNLKVHILCGAESGEHDVSVKSAEAVFNVLKNHYATHMWELTRNALPENLDPDKDFIFPLIHGDFGEDGTLQALLEARGFCFVGSHSETSRICINKMQSKSLAKAIGIPVLPAIELVPGESIDYDKVLALLGSEKCVLKPTDKGSSIGVHLLDSFAQLEEVWQSINQGHWMLEKQVTGRELSLGVVQGQALGVVEIRPKHGFYDFKNKYTVGACEYFSPAPISNTLTEQLRTYAARFFERAHCLDFARADFIMDENEHVWFLEMNTVPGMTAQSLLPKSAACFGISFEALIESLVHSTLERYKEDGKNR